jgi:hypothetical protein
MSEKKPPNESEEKRNHFDAIPQGYSWHAIPSGLSVPILKSTKGNVLKEVLIVVIVFTLAFYLIYLFFL